MRERNVGPAFAPAVHLQTAALCFFPSFLGRSFIYRASTCVRCSTAELGGCEAGEQKEKEKKITVFRVANQSKTDGTLTDPSLWQRLWGRVPLAGCESAGPCRRCACSLESWVCGGGGGG